VITERFYPQRTFDLHALLLLLCTVLLMLCTVLMVGCGTTTNRVATEQMLISNAIDESVSQIDFSHLSGRKVFLDTTFLKADKKSGLVNTNYFTSALRQQLTAAGCQIFDLPNEVDIIVEPRIGAMGTDGHKVTYGIPKTGGLSAAATAFSGSPVGAIPEISFAQSDAQSGIAKVVVFAYDKDTRQPVWQSGTAKAESNSTSTWVLGAGPFQKGSIYEATRFAGRKINKVGHGNVLRSGLIRRSEKMAGNADSIRYDSAHVFPPTAEDNETFAEKQDAPVENELDDQVEQASFEE